MLNPTHNVSFFSHHLSRSHIAAAVAVAVAARKRENNKQPTNPNLFSISQVSTSSSPAPALPLPKAPSAPPYTLPPTPELSPTFTLRPSPTKCPVRLCTQEQEQALLRQTRAALRSVAMLVDFALEFDQFEMDAFRQEGEFSRVGERGLEGTQIDR